MFKDYDKPPIRINSVPMDKVDNIKSWLDKMDIIYYETTKNFNWVSVLSEIKKDI